MPQPEAVARFNYNVPAEVERIIRKCLEEDRERRYQSARDLSGEAKGMAQNQAQSLVGRQVGPYKIHSLLGVGEWEKCILPRIPGSIAPLL